MSECSFTDTASELSDNLTPSSTSPTAGHSNSNVSINRVVYSSQHISSVTDPGLSDLLIRKQPKFQPQAPKCNLCNKSVYKAEETRAANKIFHKFCFKCTSCKKLLETNTLTEHQGDLFCKVCYGKNFGPKGHNFNAGSTLFLTENNVNKQLSRAMSNDEILERRMGPSDCILKENHNRNKLQPTYSSFDMNRNESDINSCDPNNGRNPRLGNIERRTSTTNLIFNNTDRCARCMKPVYAAEKTNAAGRVTTLFFDNYYYLY
jgi:uncharacterized protein with PIN domain